jgi:hypothetical protein
MALPLLQITFLSKVESRKYVDVIPIVHLQWSLYDHYLLPLEVDSLLQ